MLQTIKGYLWAAAGVGIMLLVLFAGWQYDQAKQAAAERSAMAQTLQQQTAVLAQLQRGQAADSAAISAMAASQAQVAKHGGAVRTRVVTMEASDAKIHDVLSVQLPPGGCLLDDTCTGGANPGQPQPSAPAVVRPAGNGQQ